jgi:putative spermidine/putrescine transport system permease protein
MQNFSRFLFDEFYLWTFLRTILISAAVTVASVVLGYPVAWHLHSVQSSRARLWLTLIILLPLMLSMVIASFAWLIILGSNGILTNLLMAIGATGHSIRILDTDAGVVIVTVYSYVSYAILSIHAGLENIDPSLPRAARIHGASDAQTFLRVILPLSIPGVVSGALIVFTMTMATFVIPYLVGGGRVKVIPLLIYNFTVQLFDWPGAAALSVMLLVVTLALTWLISVLAQRWTPWERSR